jgi:hypothetical protein
VAGNCRFFLLCRLKSEKYTVVQCVVMFFRINFCSLLRLLPPTLEAPSRPSALGFCFLHLSHLSHRARVYWKAKGFAPARTRRDCVTYITQSSLSLIRSNVGIVASRSFRRDLETRPSPERILRITAESGARARIGASTNINTIMLPKFQFQYIPPYFYCH